MASNLEAAIVDYEHSLLRAMLMLRLQELADQADQMGAQDSGEFGYALRSVWVAAHQGRLVELNALTSNTVTRWIELAQEAQPHESADN